MRRVALSTIKNKILNSNGRFFTVLFRKRSGGTLRLMNCKLNTDNLDAQLAKNLIPVYETGVGFRNIPLEGIVMLSCDYSVMRVKK